MLTVVYANPSKEGLTATILTELEGHLKEGNKEYSLIDLYADGFNPMLSAEERSTFFTGTGISPDPLVRGYQDILKKTWHVVFVFPIWWMTYPAALKGFFERTFLPNYSSAYTQTGMKPLLNNIAEFTILTAAAGVPREALTHTIENHFINDMLGLVTEKSDSTWLHLTGQTAAEATGMKSHIDAIKRAFS